MASLRRMLPMPGFLVEKPRARFALERFIEMAKALDLQGPCIDVGCGPGHHIAFMKEKGPFREVHGLDVGLSPPASADRYHRTKLENFISPPIYDGIWCSHTLEHTTNPGLFLAKLRSIASDAALICITVPPLRHDNTVGHFTLWNAGTLLLNLVRAGFDCSKASVRRSGYNISVIVRNNRPAGGDERLARKKNEDLRKRMPEQIVWRRSLRGTDYFDGNIRRMNWS